MPRENWLAERSREFASLRGMSVESWVGVEMALREDVGGSGPQFEDPEVPCLQLWGLRASFRNGSVLSVRTYQDDARFGLWANQEYVRDEELWEGIYRRRSLTELPTGHVDQVTVFVDEVDAVLAEVHLQIGQRPLLLIAGEIDETSRGGLVFHRLDESVLAFTDPAAVEDVLWSSP
ncbi:hypothetical protein [Nocardia sp. NPDC057030]|uniref:hypothetical protein n=1 Tax=unclassified Nocardia TaxID=2637762 RepID=UPI00362EB92C